MLTAVLAFTTGCGAEKEVVEYDEASVEQVAEFMIAYCSGVDDATAEQLRALREFSFEQQLAEMGLPLTPESFLSAMDSWEAGEEECGAYIGHGDFVFEASADELKVTTEAEFEDRDATLEFVFDDDLFLDSFTVSAKFTMGEIVEKAALNTLLGMGTVFVVLILISAIISLFKYIPKIQEKFKKKPAEAVKTAVEEIPAAVAETAVSETDDRELIAVIAAAIAAAEGTTTDGFVVRSIKRRKSNKWN
ncbi:MAG: OadG family transporter subunit [Eubacteriales bacterium]|nr:OadG family transporter subunit [Eubacteriales bacterium]